MSLRQFHLFFIGAAAVLAFLFGFWSFREYGDSKSSAELLAGLGGMAGGFALVVYFAYFRKKLGSQLP